MEGFESFVGVNFWTALLTLCNMIITFLVLKKFLFQPVKKMIDDRQQEIDGLYADAGNAKAQAEALQAQYDARLKAANAEGDRIIQKATRQAQEREEAIVHEAQEKAARTMERAPCPDGAGEEAGYERPEGPGLRYGPGDCLCGAGGRCGQAETRQAH